MSLHHTFATHCEVQAAAEIYPYHLVVYYNGEIIIQPDEYEQGKPILRFKCSGPMMSAHFEPLCPRHNPAASTAFANQATCPPLGSENSNVIEQTAQDQSDDDIPLMYLLQSAKRGLIVTSTDIISSSSSEMTAVDSAIENVLEGQEFKVVIRADRKPSGEHKGRFNTPATSEVAMVIVSQEFNKRDIILYSRNTQLVRISETHRSYDALQYPLVFCRGEDGYSINIPQRDPTSNVPLKKTISASDFYAYKIMEKQGDENYLLLYRSLLNQYLVDTSMHVKIETERLNFIRFNQCKLRAEIYVHLKDAMCKGDSNASDIGQRVVLPSSFTGRPRYMHERTQDAMTYVRHYARPDLFITFTCNPKWTEIGAALKDGQKPQDRHDIIARVFNLKVKKKLINLLTKGSIFGQRYKAQTDSVISAEVPDPGADPELFEIVKSTMIHGPCGNLNRNSPCMVNGTCSKSYPRPLCKETQTADDGYPQYRPADGSFTGNINGVDLDSRWVVPYNPVLTRTFLAHINVELCNYVKSIKYICKYVNKGSDQAAFVLENERDEVSSYEAGRYISCSEAAWRIFCSTIHER
ncbi:uncharacterized protein LOC124368141 [Homalodisca vitripennis]|uniref:uncharacterized protein LOC124368141 n=1 Tax=Homalodisca vitripennis TaxID=197043 RepID=UPI001EEAD7AD|nr:uncharacterized protein LOC124368141 [Homalodisca vitripennis]